MVEELCYFPLKNHMIYFCFLNLHLTFGYHYHAEQTKVLQNNLIGFPNAWEKLSLREQWIKHQRTLINETLSHGNQKWHKYFMFSSLAQFPIFHFAKGTMCLNNELKPNTRLITPSQKSFRLETALDRLTTNFIINCMRSAYWMEINVIRKIKCQHHF